jgi:predicted transcriptional regulator
VTDELALSPKKVAAIRKQLLMANTRLVALEREQRELHTLVAKLVAQLKQHPIEDAIREAKAAVIREIEVAKAVELVKRKGG